MVLQDSKFRYKVITQSILLTELSSSFPIYLMVFSFADLLIWWDDENMEFLGQLLYDKVGNKYMVIIIIMININFNKVSFSSTFFQLSLKLLTYSDIFWRLYMIYFPDILWKLNDIGGLMIVTPGNYWAHITWQAPL